VPLVLSTGAVAHTLGDAEQALRQAAALAEAVSGASLLIADGPQTALGLRQAAVKGASVASLSELLAERTGELEAALPPGTRVFVHDSRAATALADSLAGDQAIHPGFSGPEDVLGRGRAYEAPRELLDRLGLARVFSLWQRSLARSSGADDGLWLTYPRIAEALARRRLQEAAAAGAQHVVTDSLLAAQWLARLAAAESGPVQVSWLPELVRKAGAGGC